MAGYGLSAVFITISSLFSLSGMTAFSNHFISNISEWSEYEMRKNKQKTMGFVFVDQEFIRLWKAGVPYKNAIYYQRLTIKGISSEYMDNFKWPSMEKDACTVQIM